MAELSEPRTYDTGVEHGQALLPEPPEMWSYSSLKEVESCPRRYVLSRADYPDLWDKHGYPRLPNPAAIKGDVVHGSLEVIVKALVKAGCLSTRAADAVAVLRDLGGYTAVAEAVLDEQLARLDGNPRISPGRREQLNRTLGEWVPEAREQIQTYLNRMELRSRAAGTHAVEGAPLDRPGKRYPAMEGDHPERELVAEALRLKGRVDLLSVEADGATITDFKTGGEDPTHHDQLRLYALLWNEDGEVNPDTLPAKALVAAYPSRDVPVTAPTAAELADLRGALAARTADADAAVREELPLALVGEHCGLCNVRGLCDAYWGTGTPNTADVPDSGWYDMQGTVVRQHGVKSWVLRETRSGKEVLLRTPNPSFTLPAGQDVRILGAKRTVDPDEEEALIASVTSASEVLTVTV
ncbi:PD-(D/E)XK nuclease family protein [Nocardioides guangzhouensis]|uniref:PD-(D/E)XK nuclease family protein n=1 Tax=Nocardioides guangzhouensis TaxID=2497878 RepID=UPI0014382977|nr:PD-(D/E)XK nuclease family protein [Nocardioides guangzhouensis]